MKEAQIALFEDNPDFRRFISEVLKDSGHIIVQTATTLDEGLALAERLRDGTDVANVLLLDGNLSGLAHGDVSDVRKIVDTMGEFFGQVVSIGISSRRLSEYEVTPTRDVGKDGIVSSLLATIDAL